MLALIKIHQGTPDQVMTRHPAGVQSPANAMLRVFATYYSCLEPDGLSPHPARAGLDQGSPDQAVKPDDHLCSLPPVQPQSENTGQAESVFLRALIQAAIWR